MTRIYFARPLPPFLAQRADARALNAATHQIVNRFGDFSDAISRSHLSCTCRESCTEGVWRGVVCGLLVMVPGHWRSRFKETHIHKAQNRAHQGPTPQASLQP